jgi:hypothetical protein
MENINQNDYHYYLQEYLKLYPSEQNLKVKDVLKIAAKLPNYDKITVKEI